MEEKQPQILPIKEDNRPLYQKALTALRSFIERDNMKVGDQLPSEEALAKQLGISRSTIRRALNQLEVHGLISRQQGKGTFLTNKTDTGFIGGLERLETFRSLAQKAGYQSSVVERNVSQIAASQEIISLLDLAPDTPIIRVEVVEAIDGDPCIYLDDYIPSNLADLDFLSTYGGSVLDYVLKRDEEPISISRCEIFAINAQGAVVKKLRVKESDSILHFIQTHFAESGRPIGVTLTYILTDRFRFYLIRKTPE